MSQFFANVPIWVYPLFIFLLTIGLRASRTRRVPVALFCALPLMGIITLQNIIALSPDSWIWTIAAVAYSIGILIGLRLQKRWIIARDAGFVQVKGEWVTLIAIMVIFSASFVKGTLDAIAPALAETTLFATLYTAVVCLPAGHFLGRAITVLRAPRAQSA